MSDPPTKPDPYAPWRSRDYRLYASSWFAMTFSKQIETLAVMVYFVSIYSEKLAPLALGAIGLVQALPVMLLAIAGGQLADRFERRHVMMAMFSLNLLASVGLLATALLDGPVWWIFLMLGLGAVGRALGSPARVALLPQLVPTELFSKAVTWNSSVFYISAVTGPVAGGFLMALSKNPATPQLENPAPAFAVALACQLIAVAAIAAMRYRQVVRSGESVGNSGQPIRVYIVSQRHTSSMNLENLPPAVSVRDANDNLPVKAPGPAQGGIQCVGDVGCSYHDDLTS